MQIHQPKPATASATYNSAGWAKKLSLAATVLQAVSGATFLGSAAISQFLPKDVVVKLQAASAIVGGVSSAVASWQADKAQTGRLNAHSVVYTPDHQRGHNHGQARAMIAPSTNDEARRLAEVTPYIEGQEGMQAFIDRQLSHVPTFEDLTADG